MNYELKIRYAAIEELKIGNRHTRRRKAKTVAKLAKLISKFGFTNPIIVDEDNRILAGHGRLEAAKFLMMDTVPVITLSHMSDADKRAYMLAENRIAQEAEWVHEALKDEFQVLIDLGFDLELTGFDQAEIDDAFEIVDERSVASKKDKRDVIPDPPKAAVSRQGDVWICGPHKVLNGDSRDPECFRRLMLDSTADLVFADAPFNCKIAGHVSGNGAVQHREFAMASGEMTNDEFVGFLKTTLGNTAAVMRDGAIAFVVMDWRGLGSLLIAGAAVFTEYKQLCVWNKNNAGLGAFYRSKHELIAVFKNGSAPHTNNFGLGETGRHRTNVWDYPGISSFGKDRDAALALHPTVKPVALVADAIKDCSKRGELVLDPFGGSGTTMIAAESCGRIARLIEFDPIYVDVIVRRYEALTGQQAVLEGIELTFDQIALARSQERAA